MKPRIEWAVVYSDFRETGERDSGFKSQEEAEAWRAAFQMTENRQAREALYTRDAHVTPRKFWVAWRQVTPWMPGKPDMEES